MLLERKMERRRFAKPCPSPELREAINLVRVTMLQASPHVFHSNRIFDFGDGQPVTGQTAFAEVATRAAFSSTTLPRESCTRHEELNGCEFRCHQNRWTTRWGSIWSGSVSPYLIRWQPSVLSCV